MYDENSLSFKGQDKAFENFDHKDLRKADFTNANLEGATFVKLTVIHKLKISGD